MFATILLRYYYEKKKTCAKPGLNYLEKIHIFTNIQWMTISRFFVNRIHCIHIEWFGTNSIKCIYLFKICIRFNHTHWLSTLYSNGYMRIAVSFGIFLTSLSGQAYYISTHILLNTYPKYQYLSVILSVWFKLKNIIFIPCWN